MPEWLAGLAVGDVALIVGGAAAVAALLWRLFRLMSRVTHFLDDWFGEDARPGVPERPGVMERLATVEQAQQRTEVRLARIEEQTAG